MNRYMRAVGFSDCKNKKQITELFYKKSEAICISRYSAQEEDGEERFVKRSEFGTDFGLIWFGSITEGREQIEDCMPYVAGTQEIVKEELSVEERMCGNLFSGATEDLRIGVYLIFFLNNGECFREDVQETGKIQRPLVLALSGLSVSGTVLLPLALSRDDRKRKQREKLKQFKLLADARNGDEAAIENLAYKDMNLSMKVSKRIYSEDLFSIVESSFMPYGLECDQYSVIADIKSVMSVRNCITGEEVWRLQLDYNGLGIDLCINKKDLVGEPKQGRRFKGSIWLQGTILGNGEKSLKIH